MAHRLYTLGLDALIAEGSPKFKSVGLRVYEMFENKPHAYFDVSEEVQPQLLQMSSSESHLKQFTEALEQALKTVKQSDQIAELRMLRIPALNFEALWLNYEGETKDLLVPLIPIGQLPALKGVLLDEALEALREAARPLTNMDDSMGA
jgi:hypothetical protein